MVQDNAMQIPEINIGALDPNTWEEPKELIPARIKISEYRLCDPKYMAPTSFRAALPRRIWQWDLQLERLDAKFSLLDGTEAPVTLFCGIDMEKLQKNGEIHRIARTRGKEQFQVSAWTKLFGAAAVIPSVDTGRVYGEGYGPMTGKPILQSSMVGTLVMVARYREKDITGNGFFAKNVTEPTELLAPTYSYTGDVHVFVQKRGEVADGDVASAAAAGLGSTSALSKEDAAEAIGEFIRVSGADISDSAVLGHPDFPADARMEPFISAIASGSGKETLAGFGVEV